MAILSKCCIHSKIYLWYCRLEHIVCHLAVCAVVCLSCNHSHIGVCAGALKAEVYFQAVLVISSDGWNTYREGRGIFLIN